MPDRSNEPPESDHDKVVDMAARLVFVEKEVVGLRDWRHDVVAPVMMAIQAQQKQNADHIGRLATTVEKLAVTNITLAELPKDLRQHDADDTIAFKGVGDAMRALHEQLEVNRVERAVGQNRIIIWMAGLLIAGLAAVVATQWAFIAPHISWN